MNSDNDCSEHDDECYEASEFDESWNAKDESEQKVFVQTFGKKYMRLDVTWCHLGVINTN